MIECIIRQKKLRIYTIGCFKSRISIFFFFFFPFSALDDQYLSFDFGSDTVLLLIATLVQDCRLHYSVKHQIV